MKTFALFAFVATFTVATKSTLEQSGVVPAGTVTEYSCSYKKGDVRAGDSAVFELSGWNNIEIDKVTLSMKSNKNSGSGSMAMTMDGQMVWSIANSTFKDWCGEYTNSVTPIEHTFSPAKQLSKGQIRILIKGTANSIHIESYSFTYHYAEPRPYKVDLYSGQDKQQSLTETAVGSGIVLPMLADRNGWYFLGWSEIQIASVTQKPAVLLAGSVYYPSSDAELWAVYADAEEPQVRRVQQVNCQSGYYAIGSSILKIAYAGGVGSDGLIATKEINLTTKDSIWYERQFDITDNMIYYIRFAADSTATVQHIASGTFVGYTSEKKYTDTDTEWRYRVMEDSTIAFYLDQTEGKVIIWGASYNRAEDALYGEPWLNMNKNTMVRSQFLLYEVPMNEQDVHYTTQIDKVDIQTIYGNETEYIVPIGIYQIHIQHGKKTLTLH